MVDGATPTDVAAAPELAQADAAPQPVVAPVLEDLVAQDAELAATESEPIADSPVLPSLDFESQRALFWASPEDPPAELLGGVREELYGRHYVVGDEWNLQLFAPHIEGLGGGYVGVGTDQAYLLISWQRADWAWLIDYDPYAVMVHRIYRLVFERAETPEAFREYFTAEGIELCKNLIAEHFTPEEQRFALKVLSYAKGRIRTRLWKVKKQANELGLRVWLNDQERYDWLRERILSGRVRPMSGNLMGEAALAGIGETARQLSVPIRLVYFSNAEEYCNYGEAFRRNLRALPFDERSVVLRTLSSHRSNGDYRYFVQYAQRFLAFLEQPLLGHVYYVVKRRKIRGLDDIPIEWVEWSVEEALARYRQRKAK